MKKIIISVLAIVILFAMIAWMAGLFDEKIPPGTNAVGQKAVGEPVATVYEDVTILEKVPASVEASQATLISSRLIARISRVNVRAGDVVKRATLFWSWKIQT